MTIATHVRNALNQLRQGEFIGRRKTPVISYWAMRPKWEKWGEAWTYKGRDGDPVVEDGMQVIPAVLRLIYLRCADGRILQLAYVEESERIASAGSPAAERAARDLMCRPVARPETLTE